MTNQIEQNRGIHLDVDKSQLTIIIVMFALFFLAPIFGVQYYNSTKDTPRVKETYTASALSIDDTSSLDLEKNEPSVAGISTSRSVAQFKIPYINLTVTNDLRNPTNLLIVIGIFITIVSILVLLAHSLDLFKSSIYK